MINIEYIVSLYYIITTKRKFDYKGGVESKKNLVVPVNTPIKMILTSRDYLHSFYIPDFRTKMDIIPNRYMVTWFEATSVGEYDLLCAEYCGTGHYAMRGRLLVDEEKEYLAWLDEQMTFEEMLAKNGSLELLTISSNNNE